MADVMLSPPPLHASVRESMRQYFAVLDGAWPTNLYELVLTEVEIPLLVAVLTRVKGNQMKAATLLGISRGTLRSKLAHYGLDKHYFR